MAETDKEVTAAEELLCTGLVLIVTRKRSQPQIGALIPYENCLKEITQLLQITRPQFYLL
jgi:hypothetical protein